MPIGCKHYQRGASGLNSCGYFLRAQMLSLLIYDADLDAVVATDEAASFGNEAAKIGGVGLQIIRDWVLRFNALGPDGLLDGKSPGHPPKLILVHVGGSIAVNSSASAP